MSTIYFASDFHLGCDALHISAEREDIICHWLDVIKHDATELYLVGDVFDYWYEYHNVVPRGFDVFKSKLKSLITSGVKVTIFTGNHDMWMGTHISEDIGAAIRRDPVSVNLQGKQVYIAHGDGLGPGDYGYKFLKQIFRNKICQWLFARIHPNTAIGIMRFASQSSNKMNKGKHPFESFDKEWLVQHSEAVEAETHHDYYVCGHRHIPTDYLLRSGNARYINLGDWLHHYTYAVMKDGNIELCQLRDNQIEIKTNH